METNERWHKDTLMEMPEQSYTQELLSLPIPFQNRTAYLSEYTKSVSRVHSAPEIAEELGKSVNFVTKIAKAVGANGYLDLATNIFIYEDYTLEVLMDEIEWRSDYEQFEKKITSAAIAEYVTREKTWVEGVAYELGIYPELVDEDDGQKTLLYPKSTAVLVREVLLHCPPADGWYTPTDLMNYFNKSFRWIVKNAKQLGIDTEPRMLLGSHEITPHYPPHVIEALFNVVENLPPPAGYWMTAHRMSVLLRKSRRWVEERASAYKEHAEMRLGDKNIPSMHYPPEVFAALASIVENEPTVLVGWDTASGAAHKVGKSVLWAKSQLDLFSEQSKMLPDANNRLAKHYPPDVIDIVIQIASELPPEAGSWITLEEISQMVGKHRSWVERRIDQLRIDSEVRMDRKMKPRVHYRPEIVDLLQLNFLIDEETNLKT